MGAKDVSPLQEPTFHLKVDGALEGFRNYWVGLATNRVEAKVGSRLYNHLLALLLAYSESRQVGQIVARMRELDSFRNFMFGGLGRGQGCEKLSTIVGESSMCNKALLAALSYALLSQVACVAELPGYIEVPALMKYGEALRASVADAYVYALVKEYDRKAEFSEIEFIEYYPDLSLCNADESKRISHRALLQKCRVVEYSARQSCRDIDGCIELTVHESIRTDEALNSLLLDVLRNPCAYIPVDERFHWSSLYYPNWVSSSNLNCKEGKLPYSKVFLTYGEMRTQISI